MKTDAEMAADKRYEAKRKGKPRIRRPGYRGVGGRMGRGAALLIAWQQWRNGMLLEWPVISPINDRADKDLASNNAG